MLEVLLGYITGISDMINYIIDAIQSIVSSARGESSENTTAAVQDDEAVLRSRSLY